MESKYIYIVREYTDRADCRTANICYCPSVEKSIDYIVECYNEIQAELEVWGISHVTTLSIAKVELDNEESPVREYKLYSKLDSYDPSVSEQQSDWDRLREDNSDEE